MVVFTGDFADRPQQFNWSNNLIKLLQTIHAPYGKYWVYGNHDHGGYGTEILRDFMKQANFQLLQNEHTTVTCDKEKKSLLLVLMMLFLEILIFLKRYKVRMRVYLQYYLHMNPIWQMKRKNMQLMYNFLGIVMEASSFSCIRTSLYPCVCQEIY